MAKEIVVWGVKPEVPSDYVAVRPGNATITRYVKSKSETVYVHKQLMRKGRTRIVNYYAPQSFVSEALQHARKISKRAARRKARQAQSRLLGRGAEEAVKIFLSLQPEELSAIVAAYSEKFGEGKAEYLKRSYARWQAGEKSMSSDMEMRLLQFVPSMLSFESKFRIIRAIWEHTREQDSVSIQLSNVSQIPAIADLVANRLAAVRSTGMPSAVSGAVEWLTREDSRLGLLLIRRIGLEEDQVVAEMLRSKLKLLHDFVSRSDGAGRATQELDLPGLRISVSFNARGAQAMDRKMIEEQSPHTPGTQLQRNAHDAPARIENPSDLLGEALKQLPPEKAREILGAAAHAALGLQIKQREAEIDLQTSSAKLDHAADAARQLSVAESFRYESEHRSGTGRMQVIVSKEKPKRGFLSWLFG